MKRLDQRGMTLVEVTITLVLTMVVATAIIVFMVSGLRTYSTASIKADLLAQAQTAADKISNDIMLSASADQNNRIEDPNAPDPANTTSWSSDADTLILATAVEDQDRNIVYADPNKYVSFKNNVIYYLDGQTVYRRVLAADVDGNRATTTCPPASATAGCPADSVILDDVVEFTVSYRNHLNQTVTPNEARSVEVSVTLQRKNDTATKISYKSRTVFRND